jgi:hypothetical protein
MPAFGRIEVPNSRYYADQAGIVENVAVRVRAYVAGEREVDGSRCPGAVVKKAGKTGDVAVDTFDAVPHVAM